MKITSLLRAEKALKKYRPSRLERKPYTTEYIGRFMTSIGSPQNNIKAIHIAGTSGKTSTAYYAAALLQQTGQKIGLLTSPHIEYVNERVQINLEPLAEQEFCQELTLFLDLVEKSKLPLSQAEILYGFAFWEFARKQVEYMVVEVGMGGTHDATNVINRSDKTCIITDIGLDHTTVLGDTLADIASHKAGIIGQHNQTFCYQQSPEVLTVLKRKTQEQQATLHILPDSAATSDIATVATHLPLFQKRNFGLAAYAVAHLLAQEGESLSELRLRTAAQVYIPGRLEVVSAQGRTFVFDGAHNIQKLQALVAAWHVKFPSGKAVVVVAFTKSQSRPLEPMLTALAPITSRFIAMPLRPNGSRDGREPSEILDACKRLNLPCTIAVTSEEVLSALADTERTVLFTGSLHLLQDAKKALLSL